MMGAALSIRSAVAWCIIGGCIGTGIFLTIRVRTPKIITFACSPFLSPTIRTQLASECTPELLKTCPSSTDLLQKLKSLAPGTTAYTLRYHKPHQATLTLQSETPLARINEGMVVTEQGSFIAHTTYITAAIAHMPQIILNEQPTAHTGTLLSNFLLQLPAEIFEQYQIVWNNKTDILLKPFAHPFYTCTAWHLTEFTPQLLQGLKKLESVLQQRSVKQKKGRWHIDLRQPRYLMVTALGKGCA